MNRYFFLAGTLAPALRAFESPMATACLRLLTFPALPPGPLRALPRLYSCISFSTDSEAFGLYRRDEDFLLERREREEDFFLLAIRTFSCEVWDAEQSFQVGGNRKLFRLPGWTCTQVSNSPEEFLRQSFD
jgi:hypothetical protein